MSDQRISRPARWRIVTLGLVHLAIAAHIVHWRLNGSSLASIQLSEAGRFAAEGVVTAALFLFVFLLVATALFGRIFCAWGCHMLALQEACRFLLSRLGIRPKPVRLRLLWLVPLFVAAHIFFQPIVERALFGEASPPMRLELTSNNLWANLPGPSEATAAILVGGLVMVYLLGSLSFCKYVCPYGALFALADKLAPGRIRLTGDCDGCGRCTAACTTDTRVHEEVQRIGMVASSSCMRCFECVSACPRNALAYRFGRPALGMGGRAGLATRYSFSIGEEALMVALFVVSFFSLYGLYDWFPLLVSLSLSVVIAYATVVAVRALRYPFVSLNGIVLRRPGRLSLAGAAYVTGVAASLLVVGHSVIIQYHHRQAGIALNDLGFPRVPRPIGGEHRELAQSAAAHLSFCNAYGMVETFDWNMKLAWIFRSLAEPQGVERHLRRAIELDPRQPAAYFNLGRELARQKRYDEAAVAFAAAVRLAPSFARFVPDNVRLLASDRSPGGA